MEYNKIYCGDNLVLLKKLDKCSIDLIYMDPPFFTQQTQKLSNKEGISFEFEDSWKDIKEYISFVSKRFKECKRVLKDTGSIFVHCDRNASHYLKIALDN